MNGLLVAGVGNIFLGDDGFGVEVARRLASEDFGPDVTVADYGIRGVHLAYQLLEGYETFILVDALSRGDAPGTVFVLEPNLDAEAPANPEGFVPDSHSLNPATVLGMVKNLGGQLGRVLVVGCEPADLDERMGLSPPVAAAVDEALRVVRRLVASHRPRLDSEAKQAQAIQEGGQ